MHRPVRLVFVTLFILFGFYFLGGAISIIPLMVTINLLSSQVLTLIVIGGIFYGWSRFTQAKYADFKRVKGTYREDYAEKFGLFLGSFLMIPFCGFGGAYAFTHATNGHVMIWPNGHRTSPFFTTTLLIMTVIALTSMIISISDARIKAP